MVSCSIGYVDEEGELGLKEWKEMKKVAKESGIIVVDVMDDSMGISITGCGSHGDKNNIDSYEKWLGLDQELETIFDKENSIDDIISRLKTNFSDEIKNLSDQNLTEFIKDKIKNKEKEIAVPSDYRTMASSWTGNREYEYEGRGGISWAIPYMSGVIALAMQVDPFIEQKNLIKIIKDTSKVNKKGIRMINPEAIIDAVKNKKNKQKTLLNNESKISYL